MPPLDQDLVTAGVVVAIELAVGFPIFADEAPSNQALPFGVVTPLGPSWIGGRPFSSDPTSDCRYTVQVTCVGANCEQAEWAISKVRTGLLGQAENGDFEVPIAVAGGSVTWREWQSADGPRAEGTFQVVADRYVLYTTKN